MRFYKLLFLNTLILLGIFTNIRLIAAEEYHKVNLSEFPSILLQNLSNVNFEEEYINRILSNIRQHSTDNTTLKSDDVQKAKVKRLHQDRINKIQSFTKYDLDFDGIITKNEIKDSFSLFNERYPLPSEFTIEDTANRIMAEDLDGDGKITQKELIAKIDLEFEQGAIYRRLIIGLEELLALDPNKDGKLTISELKKVAISAFQAADTDQDGILSQSEKQDIQKLLRKVQEKERLIVSGCEFPKADKDEKIVFIGVYEGNTVSNVSVAGQAGETNVIPVHIESGEEKLYIITSSFSPVIMQFKGDTKRISKLLLAGRSMRPGTDNNDSSGYKINMGATGVEANKITFKHARTCRLDSTYNSDDKSQQKTSDLIEQMVGRKPDLLFTKYNVTGLHIYKDRINSDISSQLEESQRKAPEGFEKNLWDWHIRFMPGGIVNLNAKDVISDAPIEEYMVLPKWAGFSKLAYEGAVELPLKSKKSSVTTNSVNSIKLGEKSLTIRLGGSNTVKIVKNIPYFPTGLYGALSANIIIGKGVEMPKGSAGHSKVYMEETGEQIAGPGMHLK